MVLKSHADIAVKASLRSLVGAFYFARLHESLNHFGCNYCSLLGVWFL